MNFYKAAKKYADSVASRIAVLQHVIEDSPQGSIKIKKSENGRYYYHIKSRDGKYTEEYIPIRNTDLILRLADKRYARAVLPTLEKNLKAAKAFIQLHSGVEEQDVAAKIDPDIRRSCRLTSMVPEDLIKQWTALEWTECPNSRFEPDMKTECGLLVRSKSEVFICDKLFRGDYIFHYEKPLYLNNMNYPVFPDFTILNPANGSVIYWEHFGKMGDLEYARKACRKLSLYAHNNIMPGKNLICTFESDGAPLSLEYIDDMITGLQEMLQLSDALKWLK